MELRGGKPDSGVTANEETYHPLPGVTARTSAFSRRSGGGQKSGLFVGGECEVSIQVFWEDEAGKLFSEANCLSSCLYLFYFWDSQ